jgi:hypothetical protein
MKATAKSAKAVMQRAVRISNSPMERPLETADRWNQSRTWTSAAPGSSVLRREMDVESQLAHEKATAVLAVERYSNC